MEAREVEDALKFYRLGLLVKPRIALDRENRLKAKELKTLASRLVTPTVGSLHAASESDQRKISSPKSIEQ